jgi:hypothetical protein
MGQVHLEGDPGAASHRPSPFISNDNLLRSGVLDTKSDDQMAIAFLSVPDKA